MRTLKIVLAYDGTNYCGWQYQPDVATVQGTLETAIQSATGRAVRVTASGRTDSGVHALRQVASLQIDTTLSDETLYRALSAKLPEDIRILSVSTVDDSFHSIRDAVSKRYRYLIQDGGQEDVFYRRFQWFLPKPLDDQAMKTAAEFVRGKHDFASFESVGSPRQSSVRTVLDISVERQKREISEAICIEIAADGFLYNMVRNIVGSLVKIGQGRAEIELIPQLLEERDRKNAGMTAPACGLTLVNVEYAASTRDGAEEP